MKTGNENNIVFRNSLKFFERKLVLFIIRLIGLYFSIFRFKFI